MLRRILAYERYPCLAPDLRERALALAAPSTPY